MRRALVASRRVDPAAFLLEVRTDSGVTGTSSSSPRFALTLTLLPRVDGVTRRGYTRALGCGRRLDDYTPAARCVIVTKWHQT